MQYAIISILLIHYYRILVIRQYDLTVPHCQIKNYCQLKNVSTYACYMLIVNAKRIECPWRISNYSDNIQIKMSKEIINKE